MAFDGEKRTVNIEFVCRHCGRSGTGTTTETFSASTKTWSSFGGNKIIPNGWRDFGGGLGRTLLCDKCLDNPEAKKAAEETARKKGCISGILFLIVLIAIGITKLIAG